MQISLSVADRPERLYRVLHQQKISLLWYLLVYSLTFSGEKLNVILQENWNITVSSCCLLMHLLFSISLMASIFRKQMLPSFTLVQFWNNSTDVSEVTPNLSLVKAELDQSFCLLICYGALRKVHRFHTIRGRQAPSVPSVCCAPLSSLVSLTSHSRAWLEQKSGWCGACVVSRLPTLNEAVAGPRFLTVFPFQFPSASFCLSKFSKETELKKCNCKS